MGHDGVKGVRRQAEATKVFSKFNQMRCDPKLVFQRALDV